LRRLESLLFSHLLHRRPNNDGSDTGIVRMKRERESAGHRVTTFGSARFKTAFVQTCTYLASLIYQRLEPATVVVGQATEVLTEVFSNKHEWYGPIHDDA
jgi:hypothetical protein